jgi:tetratricopeptide (TPR) repeat protein
MSLRQRFCVILLVVWAVTGTAWAATPAECQDLRKHGRRPQARACYQSLTLLGDPYMRAEGFWGLSQFEDANEQFRIAVAQAPKNAMYRVRWGRLMIERFNKADASDLFNEALEIDPKNAQAYLGLAIVGADGFDPKAVQHVGKALELDPKLVEAHELLANLLLEDSKPDEASMRADEALKISSESLDAMAVRAAIELLADRSPDAWLAKIAAVNPTYGEGYALVAHHLVINRRYQDGIAYYRKAIQADPQLWSARSELGINLMRLGQEDEPRMHLEMCYDNGYRNAATVNTLRLLDSYKNFTAFRDGNTIIRLHREEAELLLPYVRAELKRAIATYEKKYQMKLPGPVQVEVYPDHEDFAVRTMGLPGLAALGVAFGDVLALDSPSGRPPGSFHWASTLRHELSHVFILQATNHRVPRWFTEGLAVHEETQASPEWGDPVTPDVIAAIRDKKLLPIADLDGGFVRPQYPTQVTVSYFQAGRICDYIQDRWGAQKLLDMVHAFAQLKTTPEVIREVLGVEPEQFDRDFLAAVDKELGSTVANFEKWTAQLKELAAAAKAGQNDAVIRQAGELIQMYPDYVYAANAYEFLSQAQIAKGNRQAAAEALRTYQTRGGRNPETLKRLASLEHELGDPMAAAATLERINYIYPKDEDLHRRLGDLLFAQKDYPGAIREFGAVLAMNPLDKVSAEYGLARAYFAAGQREQARHHVLAALENAPSYRPALQLLLQLEDADKGDN